MSSFYLGQIVMFGGNFAPRGFAFCNGQTLAISQNTALFSLLGTTYGGNGTTTFNLPDLRGRLPLHAGAGTGLPTYTLGQATGTETVALDTTMIPNHTHTLAGNTGAAGTNSPSGAVLAVPTRRTYTNSGSVQALAPATVGLTGSSQPHSNLQPYLAVSFIIAITGIFPARN